jgi:hypothetical protein
MDQRTRERLPVLPVLARTAADRKNATARHLQAAKTAPPGETIEGTGGTLRRAVAPTANGRHVWAENTAAGKRRNLSYEEEEAFWAFAVIEVLRLTGIRCEELLELTHHGITEYRLPTTGELVPLLQIAPSKTDTERLLLVSPELADVLSAIISRLRGPRGDVPLTVSYDVRERVWNPAMPLLFQRSIGSENRAFTPSAAEREGWLGEIEGLKVSLAGTEDKLAQIDASLQRRDQAVHLGMPAFPDIAGRSVPGPEGQQ